MEAHPMPGAQITSSAHLSVEAPVCVCAPERHMMCFRPEDITPFSLRRLLLPQVRPLSRFGLVLPLFLRDCMHCCIQIHSRDLLFQDPATAPSPSSGVRATVRACYSARVRARVPCDFWRRRETGKRWLGQKDQFLEPSEQSVLHGHDSNFQRAQPSCIHFLVTRNRR